MIEPYISYIYSRITLDIKQLRHMSNNRKIALITGGSRGLGRNIALALAKKGIDIILTYHSRREDALDVVSSIEESGGRALPLQLDTSDSSTFDSFLQALREGLNATWNTDRFDILINNAGIGRNADFAATTEQQFDELMNIHFKGVFFLTQKTLDLINDGGCIINISTGLTRFCSPGFAAYASMKGAIEVLTRYLAKELGPRGVRVNVLAPGAIETDFGGGLVRDNPEANKMIASVTALGRPGLPDDIGGVVAFLCTEEARWITGQRIEVSGGMNL
jgi:NAD(P)-dependent dehydrogenase (short-subunit alcohol dehydrogenase family)